MQTFVHRHDRIANPAPAGEATGVRWRLLYRAAAAAALISAVFIPIQVAVFLVWPPPLDGTAADWFTLLRNHRLAGLVDLDLLLVADNVLLIPILLALYVALRQASASVVVTAESSEFSCEVKGHDSVFLGSSPAAATLYFDAVHERRVRVVDQRCAGRREKFLVRYSACHRWRALSTLSLGFDIRRYTNPAVARIQRVE